MVKASAHTQPCKGESLGVRDDLEDSVGACKEITEEPSLTERLGWVGEERGNLG